VRSAEIRRDPPRLALSRLNRQLALMTDASGCLLQESSSCPMPAPGELLRCHGFVLADNPADVFEIHLAEGLAEALGPHAAAARGEGGASGEEAAADLAARVALVRRWSPGRRREGRGTAQQGGRPLRTFLHRGGLPPSLLPEARVLCAAAGEDPLPPEHFPEPPKTLPRAFLQARSSPARSPLCAEKRTAPAPLPTRRGHTAAALPPPPRLSPPSPPPSRSSMLKCRPTRSALAPGLALEYCKAPPRAPAGLVMWRRGGGPALDVTRGVTHPAPDPPAQAGGAATWDWSLVDWAAEDPFASAAAAVAAAEGAPVGEACERRTLAALSAVINAHLDALPIAKDEEVQVERGSVVGRMAACATYVRGLREILVEARREVSRRESRLAQRLGPS